ncbi:hypothetical protein IGS74_18065 [Aureimonas sp. OT7]|uniref:hypothetical protein n=1 Tax=Aureimonas sp. OT7 TaxID=2816454 RepID=UPI001780D2A3|nr:hypothetical protein [Aureimonas sp. OT7]QOG06408.1 hypothetical protein IGS74_18065 [Aureimonas sp. OT7]
MAAGQAAKARSSALAAERTRQRQFDQESDALNLTAQNRYQNFEGQQEETGQKLTDYFQAQALPLDEANAAAELPRSASTITVNDENQQRANARDFTNRQGAALGNLRSFGDLLGGIGRDQARDAMSIGQIGAFKRGSSSTLPYELEAANSKGAGARLFGDILGGFGSIGTTAGISGGSLFGWGGPKDKAGAIPIPTPAPRLGSTYGKAR